MSRLFAGIVASVICGHAGCHLVFFSDSANNSLDDANADATGDAKFDAPIDAMVVAPNYAFITKMEYTSEFGGPDGANKICRDAAFQVMASNWPSPDSFIAVLGVALNTSTYNAFDLLGSSQGWIRTDGAFVADRAGDFTNGGLRNALVLTETGERAEATAIWTGLFENGNPSQNNCNGFIPMGTSGATGTVGDTELRNRTLNFAMGGCSATVKRRLLCVSTGRNATVRPLPRLNDSMRIFLSEGTQQGRSGRASFDDMCVAEARAANLLGPSNTFVAFLPSTTQSALVHAGLSTTTVFTRVDGSRVGSLQDAPLTFINQFANGTIALPSPVQPVWTGAPPTEAAAGTSNCSDWTSNAPSATGVTGDPHTATSAAFVNGAALQCSAARQVYCVENKL